MGRKARLKRERRQKRAEQAAKQRKLLGFEVAPCSYKRCPNGRPPGTHLLWRTDGEGHYTACDDCVQNQMQALKLAGINTQVVTVNALAHMRNNPPQGPAVIPPPEPEPDATEPV